VSVDDYKVTYRNRFVEEGASVVVADDLVMHAFHEAVPSRVKLIRCITNETSRFHSSGLAQGT
jgi:NADH:ubiquinone oxidoreductase subunit D